MRKEDIRKEKGMRLMLWKIFRIGPCRADVVLATGEIRKNIDPCEWRKSGYGTRYIQVSPNKLALFYEKRPDIPKHFIITKILLRCLACPHTRCLGYVNDGVRDTDDHRRKKIEINPVRRG